MIEDKIKIKINNICYNQMGKITHCNIYYSVYINKVIIAKHLLASKSTTCDESDVFNTNYGKNISRAYAELDIYKNIISRYASDLIDPNLGSYYSHIYSKVYQCMANTRKYYKNLIKKQHKYINSLLKK